MTCRQVAEWLQPFGDRELEDGDQARVRDHLRSCHVCRATYEERRRLVQSLAVALRAEAKAPAGLASSVRRRLDESLTRNAGHSMRTFASKRPVRLVASLAGALGLVLVLTWMLFGRDLALARAIDQAMRQVKSAHFTALQDGREIEVWATPEAERVESEKGWMIAKGGKAYLYDRHRRRLTITKGALAQLQLLRGLNVLLLSARVRGQVAGEPIVEKRTVTLPNGRPAIRISASGRARVMGAMRDFRGAMLVDAATNLILSGEVTETTLSTGNEQVRGREVARTTRVQVDRISYNVPIPAGNFDTPVPRGWAVSRR